MTKQSVSGDLILNKALGEIATFFLMEESLENTLSIVLEKAKELTRSEVGIIGHIDTSTGNLVNSTSDFWDSTGQDETKPAWHEVQGVLDWMMHNRKAILVNNHKDTLPPNENLTGNLPIHRFISIPIFECEKLVGLIVVANSDTDYAYDDVLVLEKVADMYGRGIHLQHEHKKLNLFRGLVDQSYDAVYVIDPQSSQFLEINEAAHTLLGYERDELLAKRVVDISLTNPDMTTWRSSIDHLRKISHQIFEGEQVGKDGHRIPVEVNVRLIRIDDKEYMISVARDIRDRKKAADAIVEEKNKLDAVLTALGDGLTLQDRQFKVIYQNEAHIKRQGDCAGELCYRAYQRRDQICEGCLLALCFADGKTHRREASFVAVDGKTIYLEVSASPVRDAHGNIYAGIETVRDITSRKLLEEELLKNKKLESIGVLAGGIAHDFNNMLTAILGNISLASFNIPSGSKAQQLISSAEQACLRAKNLTQQLLTFSKGGAPITQTASISALVTESATFTLRGSKVRCVVNTMPDDLWSVEVDEGQINQVVQNLVKNAEQAMPQGGSVYVTMENVEVNDNEIRSLLSGKYLKITIRDEGHGIDPSMIEKIFDPYFTTKVSGSGLGLAICYSIIRNHQGVISVESLAGAGTAFSIYLPASDKELAPAKLDDVSMQPEKREGRILLMDDDEMIQNVSTQLLQHLGYQVESALDGERAISLFLESKERGLVFDAVILDLTVPGGMGGMDTMTRLLEIDSKVKAIVSSGYANDPIMANYKKYGFAAVIPKPFALNNLMEILQQVI